MASPRRSPRLASKRYAEDDPTNPETAFSYKKRRVEFSNRKSSLNDFMDLTRAHPLPPPALDTSDAVMELTNSTNFGRKIDTPVKLARIPSSPSQSGNISARLLIPQSADICKKPTSTETTSSNGVSVSDSDNENIGLEGRQSEYAITTVKRSQPELETGVENGNIQRGLRESRRQYNSYPTGFSQPTDEGTLKGSISTTLGTFVSPKDHTMIDAFPKTSCQKSLVLGSTDCLEKRGALMDSTLISSPSHGSKITTQPGHASVDYLKISPIDSHRQNLLPGQGSSEMKQGVLLSPPSAGQSSGGTSIKHGRKPEYQDVAQPKVCQSRKVSELLPKAICDAALASPPSVGSKSLIELGAPLASKIFEYLNRDVVDSQSISASAIESMLNRHVQHFMRQALETHYIDALHDLSQRGTQKLRLRVDMLCAARLLKLKNFLLRKKELLNDTDLSTCNRTALVETDFSLEHQSKSLALDEAKSTHLWNSIEASQTESSVILSKSERRPNSSSVNESMRHLVDAKETLRKVSTNLGILAILWTFNGAVIRLKYLDIHVGLPKGSQVFTIFSQSEPLRYFKTKLNSCVPVAQNIHNWYHAIEIFENVNRIQYMGVGTWSMDEGKLVLSLKGKALLIKIELDGFVCNIQLNDNICPSTFEELYLHLDMSASKRDQG